MDEFKQDPNAINDPNLISVEPAGTAPDQDTVDVDVLGSKKVTVPDHVAAQRALKAQYGLADVVKKPVDYIHAAIMTGNEDTLRAEVAQDLDIQKSRDLQNTITNLLTIRSPETVRKATDLIASYKPVDPASVLEDTFALKYVNSIYAVNADPFLPKFIWLKEAQQTMPEEVRRYSDIAATAIAKHQFSVKQKEDAEALVKQQGWTPFLADRAKELLQLYTEVKLRQSVEGTGFFAGGLLGENLDAQRRALFRMPWEDYKKEYTRIMDRLKEDNPGLAVFFAHAMTDMTVDEQALHSLFSVAAPFEAQALTKLAIMPFKPYLANTAKSLVKSVEAVGEETPKVAAAAGVGDLSEAGIQKATNVVTETLAGAPNETKRAIEKLTSNLRGDRIESATNPGRYGQDMANRIDNIYQAGESSVVQALLTMNRVNRTPVAVGVEDATRVVRENIRGMFKGSDNSILDIKGPIAENISNTHYFEVHLGTAEAEYFKSRATAVGKAELDGLVIRPTVSGRIAEINREIAQVNKRLKQKPDEIPYDTGIKFFNAKYDPYNLGVWTTKKSPPTPANLNIDKRPDRLAELRNERAALVKEFPNANTLKETPLPRSEGFEIVNDKAGAGWFIRYTKFLPETADFTRDSLITTKYDSIGAYKKMLFGEEISTSMPPHRFAGKLFQRFIGPEETLSKQERVSRQIATHSVSKMVSLIEANKEAIRSLPHYKTLDNKLIQTDLHKDLNRALTAAQHDPDPITGLPGFFKRNAGDLESWYQSNLKRFPEKEEIVAYFEFKKLIELDRIFREAAVFRNKARAGVEQHAVVMKNEAGETVKTAFFDAIRQPNLPGGTQDTVAIMTDVLGKEKTYFVEHIPQDLRKKLVEDIKAGILKVLRIWDPESMPLNGIKNLEGSMVRYVITKNIETQPLSWSSVNRLGGGHLTPDSSYYVKQVSVHVERSSGGSVVHVYKGDVTMFGVPTRAVGKEIAEKMDVVRKHWLDGNEAAAMQAHTDLKLPFGWEEHKGWYSIGRTPDGRAIPPRIDAKYPFEVVDQNSKIAHMNTDFQKQFEYVDKATGQTKTTFKDGTKSGSDARMQQIEFTGKRDAYELMVVDRVGTQNNPVWTYQPAKYIDPITTMDRGLSRIINTTLMDDYKFYSAEHWLQEAHKMNALKADVVELRSSPWFHFNDKNPYRPNIDPNLKRNLENARNRALDFIGRGSDNETFGLRIAQDFSDSIKGITGSTRLALLPPRLWHTIKDPSTLIRSFTYHTDMGLGNIPSFFTQFTTFGNIMFISPRHATSGAMASTLYTMRAFNKEAKILDHLDKMASGFNRFRPGVMDAIRVSWKPGWFKEATLEMERTGFAAVGHEHAFMSTPVNMSLFGSGFKNLLEFGLLPFKYGAQTTRVSGFYTAYLEWRNANPTKAITRFDRETIQARASLLDHNMSRASNSVTHTGWMSIPFQFAAYGMRLAEMMFGKRLTPMEKLRMFAGNSLMYGVPVGAIGLTGIPAADWIRKKSMDGKIPIPFTDIKSPLGPYIPGDNALSSVVMEGGLAALTAYISGGGDMSSKNAKWYDFSKWGTKGIEQSALLWSDKQFFEILGGAPYSKLKDIANFSTGLRAGIASMFMVDDPKQPKAWKVTSNDLIDMARIMASGNKAMQVYLAHTTGEWTNKNEQPVMKVGGIEPFIIGALGINPQEYMDVFQKQQFMKTQDDAYRKAGELFVKEWRRFLNDRVNGDVNNADKHASNAWAALYAAKVPSNMYGQIMAAANLGHEDKAETVDKMYYGFGRRNLVPNEERQDKTKAFNRTNELRGR